MPSDAPISVDFVDSVPFTPLKSAAKSPAPTTSQATNTRSKARNSSKQRAKQVPTSPGPAKPGRTTPPYSAVPKFTETAFAGATFHASPAPSSLPMPSFLAKAMDSPGVKENDRANQEPSPPVTDSEAPTPQRRTGEEKPGAGDSPLDLLFRAQRAEQERARRASSANVANVRPGPFSPPLQTISPQAPRTLPPKPHSNHDRRPSNQPSHSGISTQELDGTPGRPIGPAFSTPYIDRIRAIRPAEKTAYSTHSPPQSNGSPADRSAELMNFLGIKPPTAPVLDLQINSTSASTSASYQIPTNAMTHASRVTVSTSSTTIISGRSPEVDRLEDTLRKALKLGTQNLATVPATHTHRSS